MATQAAAIIAAAVVAGVWRDWAAGSAVLYGGVVALGNSGFLAWRWWRGLKDYRSNGHYHLHTFHRSSLERFFVVATFLAVGLLALKLAPLPMLTGFVLGLCAWIVAVATLKTN